MTGLLSRPRSQQLPSLYTVRVTRLAHAGYKVREVASHGRGTRTTRTYYGLNFRVRVGGRAERFSWTQLLQEVELSMNPREVLYCPEKATARAFYLLKAPTSTIHLRHS